MENGVAILVIALLLSITKWFDGIYWALEIRKAYANMLIISTLALNSFVLTIAPEVVLSPAVLFFAVSLIIAATCSKQMLPVLYSILIVLCMGITVVAVNTLPKLNILLPTALLIALIAIAYSSKPLFVLSIATAVPLMLYFTLAMLSFTSPHSYPQFDMTSCLTMQAVLILVSVFTVYVRKKLAEKAILHSKQ